ncbi:MAG: hypothetical protein Q7T82_07840 [Armatimonadota bacterium]|nr:hypothetical protein [Armatimonadota bacterium]
MENVDEFAEKVSGAGGKITMPKIPIPGVGWFVTFDDTQGNSLGLIQTDEKAG